MCSLPAEIIRPAQGLTGEGVGTKHRRTRSALAVAGERAAHAARALRETRKKKREFIFYVCGDSLATASATAATCVSPNGKSAAFVTF